MRAIIEMLKNIWFPRGRWRPYYRRDGVSEMRMRDLATGAWVARPMTPEEVTEARWWQAIR